MYRAARAQHFGKTFRAKGDAMPEVYAMPEDQIWRLLLNREIEFVHDELGTFPFRTQAKPLQSKKPNRPQARAG